MSRYGIIVKDNGNRYDNMYDINAVMGYDIATKTWFLNAFERDLDSAPDLCLGCGWSADYPKLKDLMDKIERMNVFICISNKNKKRILEEAASRGEVINFDKYNFLVEMDDKEYFSPPPNHYVNHDERATDYYNDIKKQYHNLGGITDDILYDIATIILLKTDMEYQEFDMVRKFLRDLTIMDTKSLRDLPLDVTYEEDCRVMDNDELKSLVSFTPQKMTNPLEFVYELTDEELVGINGVEVVLEDGLLFNNGIIAHANGKDLNGVFILRVDKDNNIYACRDIISLLMKERYNITCSINTEVKKLLIKIVYEMRSLFFNGDKYLFRNIDDIIRMRRFFQDITAMTYARPIRKFLADIMYAVDCRRNEEQNSAESSNFEDEEIPF